MLKLIQGDCLEEMKKIPDESVDLVLTDPPYGTNDGKGKNIKRGTSNTDFSVIEWDRELPIQYISELHRVMKPDSWGFIFTDKSKVSQVWYELERRGLTPRNVFYWIKSNKAPTPRCNFKSCIEAAVVFTKGRTNQRWYGGGNQNNYIILPFVSGREKVNHPTQKPVKLMAHLLQLVSTENDVVLDPFMGSGSTGVACKQLNRNFIGIELDKNYYNIAKQRISEVIPS